MLSQIVARRTLRLLLLAALALGAVALLAAACGGDDNGMGSMMDDDGRGSMMDGDGMSPMMDPDGMSAMMGVEEMGPPTQMLTVVAREFGFQPDALRLKVGETIHIDFRNDGTNLHDFTSTEFVGRVAAQSMGEHAGPMGAEFHVAAEPGETGMLMITPSQVGTYELFCSVAGHKELGMVAQLIVEA